MPTLLIIIILPFFILLAAACIRLNYIEMQIMNKLKAVDPNEYERLIWWFGSRAHPLRFPKFIKEHTASDSDIKKYINEYKRTTRFAIIIWIIFAIIVLGITGIGIILNYTM